MEELRARPCRFRKSRQGKRCLGKYIMIDLYKSRGRKDFNIIKSGNNSGWDWIVNAHVLPPRGYAPSFVPVAIGSRTDPP